MGTPTRLATQEACCIHVKKKAIDNCWLHVIALAIVIVVIIMMIIITIAIIIISILVVVVNAILANVAVAVNVAAVDGGSLVIVVFIVFFVIGVDAIGTIIAHFLESLRQPQACIDYDIS